MYTQLINKIKLYIKLSEEDLVIIKQLFHRREIKKNDYFLKEGQISTHICFVQKGLFRYYINQEGEEKTFYFGSEGYFITDYESFVPQIATVQNIQALEDSIVFSISYSDLQQFYTNVENGERFGRLALEHEIIDVVKKLKSFYKENIKQRYESFIKKYPEVQQRIPQYHIASYVGIKPQSLSRIRKKMCFDSIF
ncbi:Crp/Fnr family transcriptional regulator [Flavobacterium sp. GT3P67]|uniref:Crp/Fnr family transcriptional regulator n=1 Tax=Flavobacterium sp. GT3P67 TaxID=2541722 RepID=UPI001049BFD7|nr:Crp/Fnr family transcriptional regulator [Flavobacterium sp. GT3P67]TDE48464.1 Crp/Fnr family transcriptional regulator [Flavobacterium sp. GT3P67]